jgi:hypothetical protein
MLNLIEVTILYQLLAGISPLIFLFYQKRKDLNILLDQDTYHYYIWEDSNNNNEMDIYNENEAYIAEKVKVYNKQTAVNGKLENTITVE